MARITIIALLVFAAASSIVEAQNIAPNPGFELRSSCPTSISQFNGYVQTWVTANTASTDYSGCGFTGNGVINNVPAAGTSSAGMWGGAAHPSCTGSAYSEAIRANLTTPMVMGNTYQVQFRVRVDPTGTSTANPNSCVDFGMYFYHTSSPPPMTGWCCHPVTPQYSVPAGTIPRGPYATFTGNIVAGNWNAVIVGPFCNASTSSCTNYSTSRMYFNLDELLIQPAIVLEDGGLRLQGKAHPSFHALDWEVDIDHAYASFRLERSTNGVDFLPVHEQLAEPQRTLYQYLDRDPAPGLNHYRLLGIDANGESHGSTVVSLLRGENGDSQGGLLSYFYDVQAEEIRFSLNAGDGGRLRFELLDLQGRMVLSRDLDSQESHHQYRIPVAAIATGMYVLRVRDLARNSAWQAKWVR